jgi:hypothetical protein
VARLLITKTTATTDFDPATLTSMVRLISKSIGYLKEDLRPAEAGQEAFDLQRTNVLRFVMVFINIQVKCSYFKTKKS